MAGAGREAVGCFSCVMSRLLPGLSSFEGRRGVLRTFMGRFGRAGSR